MPNGALKQISLAMRRSVCGFLGRERVNCARRPVRRRVTRFPTLRA